MIYGLRKVVLYWVGKDIAGRNLAVYPDDTFIVSYPRSGNTWTRFLIANLLHPTESITFANIERFIPDCEAQSSRYLKSIPRPRVIKSHEYFDHRYKKVIYIVRDPRDIVLSYYDFQRKYRQIEDGYPMARYVEDFLHGRLSSADWGTWRENVASWLSTRQGNPDFLLVRYEDLIAGSQHEMERIAVFLGLEPQAELLTHAIERSSADRMRAMENLQGTEWISTRNKRSDIPFIGGAKAGGWKQKLPPESIAAIETAWGPLMLRLGYNLQSVPAPDVEMEAAF